MTLRDDRLVSAFLHPAAARSRIGYFSYVILRLIADAGDSGCSASELVQKVGALSTVEFSAVMQHFLRERLIEEAYPEIGGRRRLRYVATRDAHRYIAELLTGSGRDGRWAPVVSAVQGAIDGLGLDPHRNDSSRVTEAIHESLKAGFRAQLTSTESPKEPAVVRAAMSYLEQKSPEIAARLRARAHMETIWSDLWFQPDVYQRYATFGSVGIVLDTNTLVGALIPADRWYRITRQALESLHRLGDNDGGPSLRLFITEKTREELERVFDYSEQAVSEIAHTQANAAALPSLLRRVSILRDFYEHDYASFRAYRRSTMDQLDALIEVYQITIAPSLTQSVQHAAVERAASAGASPHDVEMLMVTKRLIEIGEVEHCWTWTFDSSLPDLSRHVLGTLAHVSVGALMLAIVSSMSMMRAGQKRGFEEFTSTIGRYLEDYYYSLLLAESDAIRAVESAMNRLVEFLRHQAVPLPSVRTTGGQILADLTASIAADQEELALGQLDSYVSEIDRILGVVPRDAGGQVTHA